MGRAGGGQFHHRAKGNLSHLADNKKFKFQKADVSKPLKVAGQVGYVLHFASPASPPDYLRHPIATMMVAPSARRTLWNWRGEGRQIFSGLHERMLW